MKKLTTILLAAAAVMMMTMTSFAAEDPAALLERMNAKNNSADSMDCDMGFHAVIQTKDPATGQDMNVNMDMAMKIQMAGLQTQNIRYKAETAAELMGQTQYSVIFYKDGYYYVNSDGTKLKYPMDLNAIMEKAKSTAAVAPDMDASYMKNMAVREENGMKILSYEADAARMNQYMQTALGDLMGSTGLGMNMTFREIKGEYVVNAEDYYTHMKMYMVMDMAVADQNMTVIMLMEGDVNNPGQPVEVAIPSTDGYQDIDTYLAELTAGN